MENVCSRAGNFVFGFSKKNLELLPRSFQLLNEWEDFHGRPPQLLGLFAVACCSATATGTSIYRRNMNGNYGKWWKRKSLCNIYVGRPIIICCNFSVLLSIKHKTIRHHYKYWCFFLNLFIMVFMTTSSPLYIAMIFIYYQNHVIEDDSHYLIKVDKWLSRLLRLFFVKTSSL